MNQTLPAKFSQLPVEINSPAMMKFAQPGDPIVRLDLSGPGDTGIHRIQGAGSRTYRFDFDRKLLKQCLRVPLALWELDKGGMARDILDIPGSRAYRIIVRFEQAPQLTTQPSPPAPEPAPAPPQPKRRGRPPKNPKP